ncbi:MAG: thioredoxin family protein [Thermoguttaceae bacterium]|jgi:thiol-disulfide isomerase/thioredoxin/YHS domain-containing protein
MGKIRWALLTLLGVIVFPSGVLGQQAVRWETSLDAAKRQAAESHRLVLVVFSAPWCPACRAMENEVLGDPTVVAALAANYVPTRLNVDYYRAMAQKFGISGLPTTIILAPGDRDEVLEIIRGKVAADVLAIRLNQVAANTRQKAPPVYAQVPAGPAATPAAASAAGYAVAPVQPAIGAAALPSTSDGLLASRAPPAAAASGPNRPPFGLDGFCPVELVEKAAWSRGDQRWGAVHRGRVYLFAGQEQQRRFLADPDRFAPVNSGDDVVVAVEQGQSVAGTRDHGVTFAGRIYLFAHEVSLDKFSKNPRFYAERALQAMHSGRWPEPQTR